MSAPYQPENESIQPEMPATVPESQPETPGMSGRPGPDADAQPQPATAAPEVGRPDTPPPVGADPTTRQTMTPSGDDVLGPDATGGELPPGEPAP